jgi:hypothetical protein
MTGATTGNLLDAKQVQTIPAHSACSFRIRLCWRETEKELELMPEERRDVPEGGLACLDVDPPGLREVCHVFVASVQALTEKGERHDLYSDWVYALSPGSRGLSARRGGTEAAKMPLRKWYGLPPAEFVRRLIAESVKTYRETFAYQVAKESGELPQPFDADAVSAYCYWGDDNSPLSRMTSAARRQRWQEQEAAKKDRISVMDVPHSRWERSNVVGILAAISREHPALWRPMREEIDRTADSKDDPLRRKAQFVRTELQGSRTAAGE